MRARRGPHFEVETSLRERGVWPVAGVDEVGRGPLAGPVAAAAVILDPGNLPSGVDDSKKLSAKARDAAYELIMERALAVSVSFAPASEIDSINIRRASLAAMSRAVRALSLAPAYALIDGRDVPELICAGEAIVRGDSTSLSIAAASIVAKVSRDRLMLRLAAIVHPDFGFERNAGYPTQKHREALTNYGPTPFHRLSFRGAPKNKS
jgi:ribonuclease HII